MKAEFVVVVCLYASFSAMARLMVNGNYGAPWACLAIANLTSTARVFPYTTSAG